MTLEQLINQKVQQLPSTLQQEVLDFMEFLETKQTIKPQSKQIQPVSAMMETFHPEDSSQSEPKIDMIDYLLENPLKVDNLEFIRREEIYNKQTDEQELQEILALAKKAAKQSEEMCEIIVAHRAKYKRWYEEAKAAKKQ